MSALIVAQYGERPAARVDDYGVAGADGDLPPLLAGQAVTGHAAD